MALVASLLTLAGPHVAPTAHAATNGVPPVPVTGTYSHGTFKGTFALQQFTSRNGKLFAVGLLSGTLTATSGKRPSQTVKDTIELPVSTGSNPVSTGSPTPTTTPGASTTPTGSETPSPTPTPGVSTTPAGSQTPSPTTTPGSSTSSSREVAAAATDASCSVLHLVLGPLNLNLLGLQVTLNQVNLNINAIPGAGNLLGNLLCAVAGLLNGNAPAGALADLLNGVLGLL
jgi:hypothetical protein